jgi:hypothetical protein
MLLLTLLATLHGQKECANAKMPTVLLTTGSTPYEQAHTDAPRIANITCPLLDSNRSIVQAGKKPRERA